MQYNQGGGVIYSLRNAMEMFIKARTSPWPAITIAPFSPFTRTPSCDDRPSAVDLNRPASPTIRMQLTSLACIGGLLALSAATMTEERLLKRDLYIIGNASEYVNEMCYPLYVNDSRPADLDGGVAWLADSPFPCEQELYIEAICQANGTTAIDYKAEQDCFCGSSYWDMMEACSNCFFVHGFPRGPGDPVAAEASWVKSLSRAECTPATPTQPFSSILTTSTLSGTMTELIITLSNDQFPSQTAVSNYYTSTAPVSVGQITGSATARATTRPVQTGDVVGSVYVTVLSGTAAAAALSSADAAASSAEASAAASTSTKANSSARLGTPFSLAIALLVTALLL
ncbi:hypothetical protein BP5796_05715 [Coleophoma crateriformis]|uniref:Uncharacterized protein n=1 Tax=Coleophoma crateriformis TaxID=565419 RepID=A0A3D8RUY3_9HELO|nr:hypothetical protein BP5796_05715 [Coleophoma crateriformis]